LNPIGQVKLAIVIGEDLRALLKELLEEGFLSPMLAKQNDKLRASGFRKVTVRFG